MGVANQVLLAREGQEPAAICRLTSGWVVLANRQYLRGYCILIPDPVVPSINDLDVEKRVAFLNDMTVVGDALLEVTNAFRINYAIMGNSDPVLHAHIVPRYHNEPDAIRQNLPWLYDEAYMESKPFDARRDQKLIQKLAVAILRHQSN